MNLVVLKLNVRYNVKKAFGGDIMKGIFKRINSFSLVKQIITGLLIGILLAIVIPEYSKSLAILGVLFVAALRAVAPILVLFLVMSAITQHKSGQKTNMKKIVSLYLIGMLLASFVSVGAGFLHPVSLSLTTVTDSIDSPSGIVELVKSLLLNLVDNPLNAIISANYLGILTWAILLGFLLKGASDSTKILISDFSDAISKLVEWVIKLAPLGIMGLVIEAITTNGVDALLEYGQLIIVLTCCMLFIALVVNPLIVFTFIRRNPYPLVFRCLKGSGLTAFFTRSSAANIPINMQLCEEMGLDRDTYSISIPLGATVNMMGSTVTIAVLSLSAAYTLNIEVSFPMALILCIVSVISACGASGVPGGSLLLLPLTCGLFGIPDDVAMQVVGIGFIIAVIQDALETVLNSTTDVLFTATAEQNKKLKENKKLAA